MIDERFIETKRAEVFGVIYDCCIGVYEHSCRNWSGHGSHGFGFEYVVFVAGRNRHELYADRSLLLDGSERQGSHDRQYPAR